jgi:protein-tyrosine-phosphatase
MREYGIDLSGARSKHLTMFSGRDFDFVVTLCDKVREVCPEFPGHPRLIHWSIADPASEEGSDEDSYPAFRRTAADIQTRVGFLFHLNEIISGPGGQQILLDDPSGNPVELFQPRG